MCRFGGAECRSAFHLFVKEEDIVYDVSYVKRAGVKTRASTLVLTEIAVTSRKHYVQ